MSEEIKNLLEGLPFWKHLKEEEKRMLEEASREVHILQAPVSIPEQENVWERFIF